VVDLVIAYTTPDKIKLDCFFFFLIDKRLLARFRLAINSQCDPFSVPTKLIIFCNNDIIL
jgi:hypothetical protein